MNIKRSKITKIFGIVFLVFAVVCAIFLCRYLIVSLRKPTEIPAFPGRDTESGTNDQSVDVQPITPEYEYDCPVDFGYLKKVNPDIYAWLDIPGSEISQPVLQRVGDDDYYLDHGPDASYSEDGALYTQASRNGPEFSDKCTIIYGHKMLSGAMFGTLQLFFSDPDNLREHNELIIYTPEREIRYKVFAAMPYDNRHILMSFDFDTDWGYNAFLNSLFLSKGLGAYIDDSMEFDGTDNILILSTCLRGNLNKRYLVCGLEIKEQ